MSESGTEGWNILGVRLGGFAAGLLLILGVVTAFVVSIAIMPELNWRSLARSSETHGAVALILREREQLDEKLLLAEALRAQLIAGRAGDKDLQIRLDAEAADIAHLEARIAAVDDRLERLGEASSQARAAANDMQLALHSWRWPHLAQATPGQLVLLLTLMMGALGGIIAVARAFVAPEADRPTSADYFIRPLLGAVMAFVIYMLVQVGQIMLTADGNADPLNPYPIALIAVVAGMMAAEAIAAIERWGKGLFERISAMPFGNSARELEAALAAEQDRLDETAKSLAGPHPESAGPALASAAAAQDSARRAAVSAKSAIGALSRDSSNAALTRANEALAHLKAQVDKAAELAAAIAGTHVTSEDSR